MSTHIQSFSSAPSGNEFDRLAGQTLGSYRLLETIGQGGMAQVYKGQHTSTGLMCAIKILLPHHAANPEVRERFLREARLHSGLSHPHIVRVLDAFCIDGWYGIVQEWCSEGDLSGWLKAHGHAAIGSNQVETWLLPLLDAIEDIHAQGIIHRDLKPHNVLFSKQQDTLLPKLTDFGIARHIHSTSLTTDGSILGTLQYMSPEQLQGEDDIDHRTDIYSFGVIAYQLLTGYCPFEGDMPTLLYQIISQAPGHMEALPLDWQPIIARCLEKEPGRRFQNTRELRLAIQHRALVNQREALACTLLPSNRPSSAPDKATQTRLLQPKAIALPSSSALATCQPTHAHKSPTWTVSFALCFFLLGVLCSGGMMFLWLQHMQSQPSTSKPQHLINAPTPPIDNGYSARPQPCPQFLQPPAEVRDGRLHLSLFSPKRRRVRRKKRRTRVAFQRQRRMPLLSVFPAEHRHNKKKSCGRWCVEVPSKQDIQPKWAPPPPRYVSPQREKDSSYFCAPWHDNTEEVERKGY
jgi:serine/threonine-protein kinase